MTSLNIITFKPYLNFAAIIRHMMTYFAAHPMPNKEKKKAELIPEERKIFIRNFKKAREEANLKQREIAVITGLTQPYLSKLENEEVGVSLDNMSRLAASVNKPLWQLLREK